MKLNWNKDYGRVCGVLVPPGCTQPARYEQDNHYFDQHGDEIAPAGKARQVVPAVKAEADRSLPPTAKKRAQEAKQAEVIATAEKQAETKAVTEAHMGESMSAAQLLSEVKIIPWAKFSKEAKRILGPKCPGGKDAILAALRKASAGAHDRAQRRSERFGKGQPAEAAASAGAAPAATAPATPSGDVDLAAWGMGKADYIFGKIRGAIRAQFSVVVEKKRDAIHLLVEQKVIPAHLARRDFEASDQ